ncbi:MAG: ATP-binding cassette domain-containing protein, partial [Gemmatimonadales bacterium]
PSGVHNRLVGSSCGADRDLSRRVPGPMALILRADSIGKSYGDRRVLTAATLRASAGDIVCLIGSNGCGKSTLLRIASGDLAADQGTVFFNGVAYLRPKWCVLATRGLFYLPDRELFAPHRTPREHFAMIRRQFPGSSTDDAISILGLEALLDRRCGSLSTGELRRAEIAAAMIRAPLCLLADEPLRHIDPKDRALIGGALRILAGRGCAVVITGHDVEDLFDLAAQIVWCTDGTTYQLGSPAEAAEHWHFGATYLGAARAARLTDRTGQASIAT